MDFCTWLLSVGTLERVHGLRWAPKEDRQDLQSCGYRKHCSWAEYDFSTNINLLTLFPAVSSSKISAGSLPLSQVYSWWSRTCRRMPTFLKCHVQMQPSPGAMVCLTSENGNDAATFSCPPFSSAWAFGLLGRCETSEASEAAQTVTLTQFSSSSARRLTHTPWSFWATSHWLLWELYWAHRHNSKSIPREAVLLASVNWELGIPCSFPNLRAPARAYKVLEPCQEAN